MITLDGVSKAYARSSGPIAALDKVDLEVARGEFLVIKGPSGCGKSTLLMSLGGMLRPSTGTVRIDGQDVYALSQRLRAAYRAANVGFVFQLFHLVPYLSVRENVALAGGGSDGGSQALLDRLGLADRIGHKPGELSAGERQRCAVARALIRKPKLVLADEPTGNLDPENAREVMAHLSDYRNEGGTVVVVSHGSDADAFASRILTMRAGRFVEETA
jgi:putative ABC transport system ATP-binding protein